MVLNAEKLHLEKYENILWVLLEEIVFTRAFSNLGIAQNTYPATRIQFFRMYLPINFLHLVEQLKLEGASQIVSNARKRFNFQKITDIDAYIIM